MERKALPLESKVAITCLSNGQLISNKEKVNRLLEKLKNIGLNPICSKYIFQKEDSISSGSGRERGNELMDFYLDKEIKAIFDISGGDIANEVLEYLDFNLIKESKKPFFGYSDLTTIINSIYKKSERASYLYQVRNLIYDFEEEQTRNFINSILNGKDDLFKINYKFLRGDFMEGVVIGGNIRCLLKLAGTEYMPSFKDKILFLESFGGEEALMRTYLNQLKQIGAFKNIRGILLGTFTKMEENNISPTIEELVLNIVEDKEVPIAKTYDVGHGSNSKCIIIGKNVIFKNKK